MVMLFNLGVNSADGSLEPSEGLKVTMDHPGAVQVDLPLGVSEQASALELTTQAVLSQAASGQFAVQVYVPPHPVGLKDQAANQGTLLGTYGYFPPVQDGEVRSFLLPLPAEVTAQIGAEQQTLCLKVYLISYDGETSGLDPSIIVLDAKILSSSGPL